MDWGLGLVGLDFLDPNGVAIAERRQAVDKVDNSQIQIGIRVDFIAGAFADRVLKN